MARRTEGNGAAPPRLSFRVLTPERFPDLVRLFGPTGACAGCWCMWWRVTRARFDSDRGDRNRVALRRLVAGGATPGLLAYERGAPVGWVAVEPRSAYARLGRARTLRAVDELPVWSVTCLYVARGRRRRGITAALLDAATRHAFRHGAPAVEAYPVVPVAQAAAASLYTGVLSTYQRAGFRVVARPSPSRAIVRRKPPRRPGPPKKRGSPGVRRASRAW